MIKAVKGIDFHVEEGEIVSLIGANGAGKTMILRTISGLEAITGGKIVFKGNDLTGKVARDTRVKMGIAHVPEGRRVFPSLTVRQNLELGAILRRGRQGIERDMEYVFQKFPRLKEREKQLAGTLSGGEQQMLAIGRAILTQGDLLLLDEPSMGLAPLVVEEIFAIIKELNELGKTILLIEQNASMALNIASRAYVLETGLITKSGDPKELFTIRTSSKHIWGYEDMTAADAAFGFSEKSML